jgi:hypothetical protein
LAEHDHGLVPHALGHVVEALDRLAEPDQREEQARASVEERAADREERGERERSQRDVYENRAFLGSTVRTAPSGARR